MIREFFPNGRRIFSECADDLLETHLTSVVNKAVVYENEVGPDLIAEATDLRDKWLIIHDASKESTAQKADAEARRHDARAQLEDELFLNLNKVVELHPNEPDQLGLYMQQYLLGGPSSGPVSGTNHNQSPATVQVQLPVPSLHQPRALGRVWKLRRRWKQQYGIQCGQCRFKLRRIFTQCGFFL